MGVINHQPSGCWFFSSKPIGLGARMAALINARVIYFSCDAVIHLHHDRMPEKVGNRQKPTANLF